MGQYLVDSENMNAIEHITGQITDEKLQILNGYLKNRLVNNPYKTSQHIFLHYSNQEHTYEEHIRFLLQDLNGQGYCLEEDVADYPNHSDISYFFPDYLCHTIAKLCAGERIQ